MLGTTLETTVRRVVDGDTLIVPIEGDDERLRLLSLDTEESQNNSGKPVTPLGQEATAEARRFWNQGDHVVLDVPGNRSTTHLPQEVPRELWAPPSLGLSPVRQD